MRIEREQSRVKGAAVARRQVEWNRTVQSTRRQNTAAVVRRLANTHTDTTILILHRTNIQ